jgi:hypothetical protein
MTPRESPIRHPTVAEIEAHVRASSSLRARMVVPCPLAHLVRERREQGIEVSAWTVRGGQVR